MSDIRLHDLVTVRVIGTPSDEAVVASQLGPVAETVGGSPDITVEFVDHLPFGELTLLGKDEWAYDHESLVILRGKHKAPIRVRLPLDTIGHGCHIVVERGAPAVPYLVALVNLAALANGGLALHAAAFQLGRRGFVVTGWSKGGKTESLLAALAAGASYIGDEWLYLQGPPLIAGGMPEPIRVWDWYFDQDFALPTELSRGGKLRKTGLKAATESALAVERRFGGSVTKSARRIRHLLEGQQHTDISVRALNGQQAGLASIAVDAIVHVVSTTSPETRLVAADADDIAARMAASLAFERLPLMSLYHAFRYAFPGRTSALIEEAASLERDRLRSLLAGTACFELSHPYPPDLAELRAALESMVSP